MNPVDESPRSKEELIHEISDMLERFDRAYLQNLVNRLNRDALAQVWARINRYNRELSLVTD
jgi:hypothetical protein